MAGTSLVCDSGFETSRQRWNTGHHASEENALTGIRCNNILVTLPGASVTYSVTFSTNGAQRCKVSMWLSSAPSLSVLSIISQFDRVGFRPVRHSLTAREVTSCTVRTVTDAFDDAKLKARDTDQATSSHSGNNCKIIDFVRIITMLWGWEMEEKAGFTCCTQFHVQVMTPCRRVGQLKRLKVNLGVLVILSAMVFW